MTPGSAPFLNRVSQVRILPGALCRGHSAGGTKPPLTCGYAGRERSSEASERDRQHRYYLMHLRASTNRGGQPYSERTVGAYSDAVASLNRHLTETGFAGDFTEVDAEVLNGYFAAYLRAHGQGGTVTKQGNLRPFCAWLAYEFDSPDPYTDRALNRYARIIEPPPVLDEQIITALLSVTKGKDYEAIRDHAIVRLLLTGMRRQELASLRVQSVDLTARVLVTVGLKGKPGRPVAFGHKTAAWQCRRAAGLSARVACDRACAVRWPDLP
jgi:site-specific recombinase XerD